MLSFTLLLTQFMYLLKVINAFYVANQMSDSGNEMKKNE